MTGLERIRDITSYRTFTGLDGLVHWSHLQLDNSESSFYDNSNVKICCLLMENAGDSCKQCPSRLVFEIQVPQEALFRCPNGELWQISVFPAYDNTGNLCGILEAGKNVTSNNIPDIKPEKGTMSESERLLTTLMANLPGMVYRCRNDVEWTMEFVSQSCFDLTGFMPEDIIGNKNLSFNDLIVPEDQLMVWEEWQEAIAAKRPYKGEYRIITSEGILKWVWEQGQAIFDDDGEVIALEGFIQDITDQKRIGLALAESEHKYRNLIESALVGSYSTTVNGKILIVNEALCRMLEFDSPEELKSVKNAVGVYKEHADRSKMLEAIKQAGKLTDYELSWKTKTGREIIVAINAVLIGDMISGMAIDITNRKKTEQQLLEQKERAEQSDKLKAAFLANISHEIRTPLIGILGFADILIEQEISKADKDHYSNVIHNLSNQLLSIINDIFEISRIETNQIKLSYSQINVNQILNKLLISFRNSAKEKKLLLTMESDLDENQSNIIGDGFRLDQILTHLLNNALKFTYSGSVNFGCRLSNEMLQFYVKDTGIGINPENKDIIFERFRQAEDTLTRKHGGSGLGLSISKALVKMMGGEITVDSDSVTGSTFYFTIPYNFVPLRLKTQRNPLETKSCLRNSRILICEDDDFGYLLINRLLTQAGATTIRSIGGRKAIKICHSEEELDLIIMDLRMPEMSGYDAAAIIKRIRPSIPIVVCTASSGEEVASALNKGTFDDVIFKPINSQKLLETICKLL